jgi:sterol desaturase/sphingolipid hydroxylase (fatty acid hydroxylase superfamily)
MDAIDAALDPTTPTSTAGLQRWVRYGLYPFLWCLLLVSFAYASLYPEQLVAVQMIKGGVMITLLLACEWLFPYQRRWGMTRELFFRRDLVFLLANGLISRLLATGFAILAVYVAGFSSGPMSGSPLWLQVITGLLVFEALQYPLHRLMHQSRGPLTHFLWRSHAVHHLPAQLYLVMHAVLHPVNSIVTRVLVMIIPVALLGYDQFAVFVFMSIVALHATISHFNVDIRMGKLNYVFVGPELHRYHHSANSHEAVNYSAILPVFDWLFGTFLYRPGMPPAELGLSEADGYPGQVAAGKALLFPFHAGAVTPS